MVEIQDRIRSFYSPREFQQCIEIQELVWQFDYTDLVSIPMLKACQKRGGILLGSFQRDDRLEGFVFSFPAPWGNQVIQHSHMLAVRPELRDAGLGNALKWAQHARARELGNPLITWTFDPLEARNAHLNLNKLGVRVHRYYVNLYGEATSSPLHSGLGTDRLLAEWKVFPGPDQSLAGRVPAGSLSAETLALGSRPGGNQHRLPGEPRLDLDSAVVALEIPVHTQRLKQADLSLAIRWRQATRKALVHYLESGYAICGLWVTEEQPRRTFYCLRNDLGE